MENKTKGTKTPKEKMTLEIIYCLKEELESTEKYIDIAKLAQEANDLASMKKIKTMAENSLSNFETLMSTFLNSLGPEDKKSLTEGSLKPLYDEKMEHYHALKEEIAQLQ